MPKGSEKQKNENPPTWEIRVTSSPVIFLGFFYLAKLDVVFFLRSFCNPKIKTFQTFNIDA